MYLKDVKLYPIQVINQNNIIFDDMAENLPNEIKDYEIKNVDFKNNKLIFEI